VSSSKPKLAVFKLASCDGCQLQLLNLEEMLLALAERVEIAYFPEATSHESPGPYDIVLVEGSVTTPHDLARIRRIRDEARTLVTIGACATAGGIQWLRNTAEIEEWKHHVYPSPQWLDVLPTSTPVAAHVKVDHEIHGCPVNEAQVLRVLVRLLLGATPDLPGHSVCLDCKRRGHVCVLVSRGLTCLGPVTRAGCGALCPGLGRECYGCFGPSDGAQVAPLADEFLRLGLTEREIARRFSGVTGNAPAFRGMLEARRVHMTTGDEGMPATLRGAGEGPEEAT
jgi:coenzyme F420-reducing hydrogenase gamma subunit